MTLRLGMGSVWFGSVWFINRQFGQQTKPTTVYRLGLNCSLNHSLNFGFKKMPIFSEIQLFEHNSLIVSSSPCDLIQHSLHVKN